MMTVNMRPAVGWMTLAIIEMFDLEVLVYNSAVVVCVRLVIREAIS